jgi:hypothetical protein
MSASQSETLRWFQLYLLGNMRAAPMVERALRTLGANATEMEHACEKLAARELSASSSSVELLREILGLPHTVTALVTLNEQSPFRGSKTLGFRLPLWPAFEFLVNVHPHGYAWGLRFARSSDQTPIPPDGARTVGELAPWTTTIEEVTSRFGPAQREDRWGVWEDWSLSAAEAPGMAAKRYLLSFDFALLHRIIPLQP